MKRHPRARSSPLCASVPWGWLLNFGSWLESWSSRILDNDSEPRELLLGGHESISQYFSNPSLTLEARRVRPNCRNCRQNVRVPRRERSGARAAVLRAGEIGCPPDELIPTQAGGCRSAQSRSKAVCISGSG